MGRKQDDVFLLGDEVLAAEPPTYTEQPDQAPEPGPLPPGGAPDDGPVTARAPRRLHPGGRAPASLLLGAAAIAAALALAGLRSEGGEPEDAAPPTPELASAAPRLPAAMSRSVRPPSRRNRPREARPAKRWREPEPTKAPSRSPRASRAPGSAAATLAPPIAIAPQSQAEDFGFEQ